MKQTFKFWIFARTNYTGKVILDLSDFDWRIGNDPAGRVFVSEHSIELDVPDVAEVTPAVIEQLEAKKKEMAAVSQAAIAEIDGQIQSLLALEHSHE